MHVHGTGLLQSLHKLDRKTGSEGFSQEEERKGWDTASRKSGNAPGKWA